MGSDLPTGSVQLIRLNVAGTPFEIERTAAAKHPNSLFSLLASHRQDKELLRSNGIHHRHNGACEEWYIQRPVSAFGLIMDYLCTGALHCPQSVCKEMLKRELAFWRLDRVRLAACCWDEEDDDANLQVVEKNDKNPEYSHSKSSQTSMYVKKIQAALKKAVVAERASNTAARVFSWLSVFFILLAIVNIAVSTLPVLQTCREPSDFEGGNVSEINSTNSESIAIDGGTQSIRTKRAVLGLKYREHCEGHVVFEIIEAVCVAWFTLEWILRFSLAPNKRPFLKSPLNIIDLLSVVPFYIDLVIWLINSTVNDRYDGVQHFLTLLRVFRIFRLFNVVRLARYSESLRLLSASLWQSRSEFGVLIIFIIFLVTIFSSAVFYCEKDQEGTLFTSIPATLWWGVVTLTTTGYGDMVPESIAGKALASVCCTIGLVVMAFPVSILAEHFHRLYRKRIKRASPDRLAVLLAPNEIGIVPRAKLGRIAIYDYVQTTKL